MTTPLDHPFPERPHRVYIALTNHCNRECPWCCVAASPRGKSWITEAALCAALPEDGLFQVQLEGGEPTLHPRFAHLVALLQQHPRCDRVLISTNGTTLPADPARLAAWLTALGNLTLKLSINHVLLDQDPHLLAKARSLVDWQQDHPGFQVILNLRLRPGQDEDLMRQVHQADLHDYTNCFDLQRIGRARDQQTWQLPFLAGHNCRLVNPDGQIFGTDLIRRAEAMARLP